MQKRRTTLPLLFSRAYFRKHATSLPLVLGGELLGEAKPREYTTGSLGWGRVCKTLLKVGECYVWAQINLSITLIGTKALPRDDPAQAPPPMVPAATLRSQPTVGVEPLETERPG